MDFARTVDGDFGIIEVGGGPAESDIDEPHSDVLKLVTMTPLPREVIEVGIAAFFDRFHWFVMLLHEPFFVKEAAQILSRTAWKLDELCNIMLLFMVTICGFQCVAKDPSWRGHRILQAHSITANCVIRRLLKEVGVHFYDLLTQSKLEAYQTVMLLEIYNVYFGSLTWARHMVGVPVRVADGLGLQRDKAENMDETTYQVGIRCWNHAIVGELFGAMIYGHPSSLDPEFARFKTLSDLPGDEVAIPSSTLALPILRNKRQPVSMLTFHVLKFQLYRVVQMILQQIKILNLQQAISMQDLRGVVQAVDQAEFRLRNWRESLPAVFDPVQWGQPEPWEALHVDDDQCTPEDQACRWRLALQGIILQVLHDAAVILAHRPLLQCRVSMVDNDQASTNRLEQGPESLKISTEAALRISRRPIHHFRHHLALSFVFMHFFTAGVILCVPPIHLPYSPLASESKSGVLRIITASREMSSANSIARHTDQVLTKLYRKTIQREMDGALRQPGADSSVQNLTPAAMSLDGFDNPVHQTIQADLLRQGATNGPIQLPTVGRESELGPTMTQNRDKVAREPSTLTSEILEQQFGNPTSQPMVSYLQFGSLNRDEPVGYGTLLSEHLDEAFGSFEELYDLNFMAGVTGNMFESEDAFREI